MRTIALAAALASATLMTGCVSAPCDPPLMTIYWELSDAAGNMNVSCTSVTTASVDIYLDGLYMTGRPCSDYGATFDVGSLPPGSHTATVEGIDADGTTIWSRDQFQVTVGDCNANPRYTARPGEGTLALDYLYPAGDTCSGGYMWYSLFDEVAGQTISAITTSSSDYYKTLWACGGNRVEIAVPFGSYTLDWMQEVVDPLVTPTPAYQACAVPASVTGAGVTGLDVHMTPWTANCP